MECARRRGDNGVQGAVKAASEGQKPVPIVHCPTPGCGRRLPLGELHVSGWFELYCRHCKRMVKVSLETRE